MTLKEQVERLKSLKRRLAIWEAMHHLMDDKFISKDSGRKVGGIREPETGDVIQEDEIEDVLKTLSEGPILEIKAEITSLESGEVVFISEKKATA